MEGIYFEVKRKSDSIQEQVGSQTDRYPLHAQLPQGVLEDGDKEVQYRLQLVGSLPVHPLTTMTMLPWIVAEIRRPRDHEKNRGGAKGNVCAFQDLPVCLRISGSAVRCCLDAAPQRVWDPLHHAVLFEYRPHHIHKLIHNSQEPSYFGCLVGAPFAAANLSKRRPLQVPEIISTLRQAGKSSARQEEAPGSRFQDGRVPEDMSDAAAFAKKFEVLFCGRVCVAHKKAPPALIDECIEKFGHASGGTTRAAGNPKESGDSVGAHIRRALFPQAPPSGARGTGSSAQKTVFFRKDPSFPSLQALDENGLSPELHNSASNGPSGVQPTSIRENRTMLFTIGKSQIFLVSPDTKKVAMEKGFREISFCSQGIRHVDHFGFICRESLEGGSFQFVCYVFQCTDEALVDEIMLTLKQAFSVAALQQTSRTQSQQCEFCPMQQLHRLCERIEGLHPSKVKLELQKHLATLQNDQQASVFESILRARPKTEQEENELVVASLRGLYEELQRAHSHGCDGSVKQVHGRAGRMCSKVVTREGRPRVCVVKQVHGRAGREVSREDPVSSLRLPSSPLKSHNSTGDLQQLKAPSPDLQRPLVRRRASTFSHLPTPSPTGPPAPQEPTAATKPKLVRHYSVSTDSPHQSNSPAVVGVVGEDSPLRNRRHSWRQQIFLRVATPQKTCDTPSRYDGNSILCPRRAPLEPPLGAVPEERRRRSRAELRELWRKAVLQQILLLRMERENLKLQASENDLQNKRLKLVYEEITPCLKDVTQVWEKMLGTVGRAKIKFDMEKIHAAVGQGVPRQHRGEIWKFLSEQYLLRQPVTGHPPSKDTPYKELLKQLTSHQHAILVDLGRTFPTHPYFSAQLGAGQLSLYNLLKAYSLLDPEVGYCQGLSFVAGVLLLHNDEREAFGLLRFLMFDIGLRRQYRPDMIILQVQMYQLSRLLHDYHRDLYCHLEQHEIGPSLYAAPWFLTAFASHFPLGFVARVFDMLFLQGSEVIFKVALSLLGSHKPLILQHDNLEAIVDFIKTTLPNLGLVQMEKTISQVFEMDLSKQLQAYEVEYHVLQDELLDGPSPLSQAQRAAQLEKAIGSLRQQNLDLLEELQVAHAKIRSLESNVEGLLGSESGLRQEVCTLEQDRAELRDTVAGLRSRLACFEPQEGQGVGPSTNGPPPLM
uniref:TBC1 domain family member 4 n=1 Tax=Paramormyrops kingsleyae TaxID=1676925 RepID=A0A3B3RKQ0_9TELE